VKFTRLLATFRTPRLSGNGCLKFCGHGFAHSPSANLRQGGICFREPGILKDGLGGCCQGPCVSDVVRVRN